LKSSLGFELCEYHREIIDVDVTCDTLVGWFHSLQMCNILIHNDMDIKGFVEITYNVIDGTDDTTAVIVITKDGDVFGYGYFVE